MDSGCRKLNGWPAELENRSLDSSLAERHPERNRSWTEPKNTELSKPTRKNRGLLRIWAVPVLRKSQISRYLHTLYIILHQQLTSTSLAIAIAVLVQLLRFFRVRFGPHNPLLDRPARNTSPAHAIGYWTPSTPGLRLSGPGVSMQMPSQEIHQKYHFLTELLKNLHKSGSSDGQIENAKLSKRNRLLFWSTGTFAKAGTPTSSLLDFPGET